MNICRNKNKAFTIIELIVAIAIISILSAIVVVNISNTMKKGRNAKRLTDINNYATAIELAFIQNGEYPDPDLGATEYHCLGDYENNECYSRGTKYIESSTLNDILDEFIGLPADEYLITAQGKNYGYVYRCTLKQNDICKQATFLWAMEGINLSCGVGTLLREYGNNTVCYYFTQ